MKGTPSRSAGRFERGIALGAIVATAALVAALAATGCGTSRAVDEWVAMATPVLPPAAARVAAPPPTDERGACRS